jgi:hypothetical protein
MAETVGVSMGLPAMLFENLLELSAQRLFEVLEQLPLGWCEGLTLTETLESILFAFDSLRSLLACASGWNFLEIRSSDDPPDAA